MLALPPVNSNVRLAQIMRLNMSKMAFLVALALHGTAFASPASNDLSAAAKEFVANGALRTIGACNLRAKRCGEERLAVVNEEYGESNDERRVKRKMALPGLEVVAIFPVGSSSQVYLGKVVVTSAKWPVSGSLGVGASRKRVISVLGRPTKAQDNGCIVYFSEEAQMDATFCFKSGVVSKIVWEATVD